MLETADRAALDFDQLVQEWFRDRFCEPTEPQRAGWPRIRSGSDVLISAPTGSGKTLAAFLSAVDRLVTLAKNGLADETHVLYVSPLKALVNDVHKNLELPLQQIAELAALRGVALAPIRVALRTGDTPPHERARMVAKAPHILVTTPESLFILLTSERARGLFRTVSTVIVDEIHAMVGNKRGPHLALSLARLDQLVADAGRPRPQRIGLSATVKPVEEAADFLRSRAYSIHPEIVDVGHGRAMELSVWVPQDELGCVATTEMWQEIYDHISERIRAHRTTLVFVSTRRLAERVTHNLIQRLGEGVVMPHHGSLARRLRQQTEDRLKRGELQAVVATASLELGIDIGSVDLAIQLGSPRSIATALQRIGRSGHWVGALPKGELIATTRDDLVECAALVHAVRSGAMDRLQPCREPLDILAQQIVAACACDDWSEDRLFELVRSCAPYRHLPRAEFDAVVSMLADGIATSRGRAGALVHHDRVNGRLRGRRGARLAAITGGGAIPDATTYAVVAEPDDAVVGTVDEDFAVESMSGDIFLLGTTSWRVKRVEQGRVRVDDAHGAPPSIPFWNGEAPGRTMELSHEVSRLRVHVDDLGDGAAGYLQRECGVDRLGAEQIVAYVRAGRAVLGLVPSQETVVAERFFDESGGMQLVVHSPFGVRVNRAWGLALRKRFCRSFNLELQAAATDNGIVISLSEQHAFPLEIIFEFLKAGTVEEVLTQAMLPSPLFAARWRWNAQRSLAVPRFARGRKVPAPIQRMRSDDLMAAVFPDQAACPENLSGDVRVPKHPLVDETVSNALHEAMDLDGLQSVLARIERGEIKTVAIDTPEPSLFSHEILNANPFAFLDDAPLEERRARAVQLRSTLRVDEDLGAGQLDPDAVLEVAAQSWPIVRDADELHDALLTLVACPPLPHWQSWFDELAKAGRAATLVPAQGAPLLWVAAERREMMMSIHPDARMTPALASLFSSQTETSAQDAATELVRGWLESSGPATAAALAQKFSLALDQVEGALLRLEHEGQVLRGIFSQAAGDGGAEPWDAQHSVQWINRRVLARIHRLTLGRLRREIEPVTTAQFDEFVRRWQHEAYGTQLHGLDGTLQIIRQLQGLEYPAEAWEREVLPARVTRYQPLWLDKLCASGEVMWGRLSPHPAFDLDERPAHRRVRPTRVAPVSLFTRESAEWLLRHRLASDRALSSRAAAVRAALHAHGASFFLDLMRVTGLLASEVEDGLWELVAAGLVTADGFDNLRSLIDPKRRLGVRRARALRPRNAPGRWALLAGTARPPDVEATARQLLTRWGVLTRDVARRETVALPWRDLLVTLRSLEARGEIRGGRFVESHVGEQFAIPDAVDALRSLRRTWPARGEDPSAGRAEATATA